MKFKLFLLSIALSPICAFAAIVNDLTYAVCATNIPQFSAVHTYSYVGNNNWLISRVILPSGQTATQSQIVPVRGTTRGEGRVQGGQGQPSLINPVFIIDTNSKICRDGELTLTLVTTGTN